MVRFLTMLGAAGLIAATAAAPVPAAAQQRVVHTRTVVTHAAPRYATRRVCRTRWVHHRRVRTCRTVRYRR